MRYFLLGLAALMLMGGPVRAQKPAPATASGTLTLDGKPIPLKFAYALQVDNVETAGMPMDDPSKYLVIVLSNRSLPPNLVADRGAPLSDRRSPALYMNPLKKTEADQMYGILIKYDLVKKAIFVAQFLYPNKEIEFTIMGSDIPDKLTGLKITPNTVSGTALLSPARSTGLSKGPKKYQYRVTFHAPLRFEPAVTEKKEGKEALDSEQIQVLRTYLQAAKAGNIEELKKLTAAAHQDYLKSPEVITGLKEADMSKIEEQVKRVVVRGNRATLLVVSGFSQVQMQMVRENGVWKMCWP